MLEDIRKVHIIGAGGIGLSALAKFFLSQRKIVTGSDLDRTFIIDDLQKLGAKIHHGHNESNLDPDTDLIVYSDAVPVTNPERKKAKELRIKEISYFQMLGVLSRIKSRTIAISGNKGKTTTSAMLATILEEAKLDPTAVVGSYLNKWKSNFRQGESSYFVVEGDEWKDHMNELSPWAIILTNIQPDHLDYFGTFENEIAAFQRYIDKLPGNGMYFYNADDPVTAGLKKPKCKTISFGIEAKSDLMAANRQIEDGRQTFELVHRGRSLGRFELKQPGLFNLYNALGASATALELQISPEMLRQILSDFKGTWRRFQILGDHNGAAVVSDYAHHPEAVKATIKAAREFYPGRRIVAVFQPHHHHRTKSLFNEFVTCFDEADMVILNEIYAVEGRDNMTDTQISSLDLLKAISQHDKERGASRTLEFGKSLTETRFKLHQYILKDDVILMMGAGDIYQLAESLN